MDRIIVIYFISIELKRSIRNVSNLHYHLNRCKKEGDKAKLLVMIIIRSLYISRLFNFLKEEINYISRSLILNN